jgi:hypothetical protein
VTARHQGAEYLPSAIFLGGSLSRGRVVLLSPDQLTESDGPRANVASTPVARSSESTYRM